MFDVAKVFAIPLSKLEYFSLGIMLVEGAFFAGFFLMVLDLYFDL